jgi:hypothetical protein
MRRPSLRFTVRSLLLALALIGLNMGGAIATSKYYFRERPHVVSGFGDGRGRVEHYSDGSERVYVGNAKYGYKLVSVERAPSSPQLLQVWSPVIGSASITLVALILAFWHSPRRAIGKVLCRLRAQ